MECVKTGKYKYIKNNWLVILAITICNINNSILAGSLLSAMDLNADPCEDFFQYACGTWVKKHVISEDRSSSSTFEVMADDLQVILKGKFQYRFNLDFNNVAKIYCRSSGKERGQRQREHSNQQGKKVLPVLHERQ